jgi:hypothetical protein
MIRLIIHIGTHKTGTTSFQRKIRGKRAQLAKKDGIHLIIPQEGFPIHDFMRLTTRDHRYEEEFRSFLRKRIRKEGTYLISCEYLSGDRETMYANSAIVATMLRAATADFPTQICVMFRRQDEFIQSMYIQKVHRGEAQKKSIEEFLETFALDLLDWKHFIQTHLDLFGHGNVHIFPYDRAVLREHSVMSILNRIIGSSVLALVKEEKRDNIGYSNASLKIAMKLNDELPERQKTILREALQKTGHKKFMSEYNILNRQKKQEIVDHFKETNTWLSKTYFQKDFGITGFSDPIFDCDLDSVEDRYFELTRYLLNEIEKGSYLDRNRVFRTVKLFKKALRG